MGEWNGWTMRELLEAVLAALEQAAAEYADDQRLSPREIAVVVASLLQTLCDAGEGPLAEALGVAAKVLRLAAGLLPNGGGK